MTAGGWPWRGVGWGRGGVEEPGPKGTEWILQDSVPGPAPGITTSEPDRGSGRRFSPQCGRCLGVGSVSRYGCARLSVDVASPAALWCCCTSQSFPRPAPPSQAFAPLSTGKSEKALQTPPAQSPLRSSQALDARVHLSERTKCPYRPGLLNRASWSRHWPLPVTVCSERHLVVPRPPFPQVSSQI